MPTVVALTARSADRSDVAKAASSSATARTRVLPTPWKWLASVAADAGDRLPTVTRLAPARRHAYTTA